MNETPTANHPVSQLFSATKAWYCGRGCNVFTTTQSYPECGACGETMTTEPDGFDDAHEDIENEGIARVEREVTLKLKGMTL